MTFVGFYLLFAITTAIVAVYELFWPVVSELKVLRPELQVMEYWKTSVFTLFLGALLFAPVIFPICIIPSWSEKFRKFLTLELEKTP